MLAKWRSIMWVSKWYTKGVSPHLTLVKTHHPCRNYEPFIHNVSSHIEWDELVPKPHQFKIFNGSSHMVWVLSKEAATTSKLECFWSHSHMVLFKSPSTKVDVPNLVTYLDSTSIFEWHVVRCDSKNGHQKNMCPKYIILHVQNMITILSSIVNIIWGRGPIWSLNDYKKSS